MDQETPSLGSKYARKEQGSDNTCSRGKDEKGVSIGGRNVLKLQMRL